MRRLNRVANITTKAIATVLSLSLMFGNTLGSYAEELNTATALYEEGIAQLESAEAETAPIAFGDTEETAPTLDSYAEAAAELDTAAEAACDNAGIANTSDDKDVAYAAKDDAVSNLSTAEEKLAESISALEAAQAEYAEADAAQQAAQEAYDTAAAELATATTDTATARATLEAAQKQIEVQEEKKNALEKIEEQYYGELVYFFYLSVGENNIVFDEDGRLNVEATAANMTEDQAANAGKIDNEYLFRFGRKLTKELVEYMVLNRDDVDPETAEFTFGTTGSISTKKKAQEAVVFTNQYGHDMVVNKEPSQYKKDISGNEVYGGEVEEYLWGTTNYNSGRGNHTEVTYKDVSGNLHTEYYNYVRKNASAGDVTDYESGNLFLAVITQGEDGKWYPARVEDENNYDDYNKLTAAIEALNQIEDYNKAKADVAAALARVEALEATLATLTANASAESTRLTTLKNALIDAKADLDAAEANKANLQATYDNAKAVVESIDLSRFDIVVVPAPAAGETPAAEPAVVEIVPAETPAAAAPVVAPAPVAEVPAVSEEVTEAIEDIVTAIAAAPVVAASETPVEVTEVIAEEIAEAPVETSYELTEADIDADLTPLANLPLLVENMKSVWWIWIVIAATIITMYIFYKRTKKEEETH